jgi:purine-binding chemotaxis protein CheW
MSSKSVASRRSVDEYARENVRIVVFDIGEQRYAFEMGSVVGIAPLAPDVRSLSDNPLLWGIQSFRGERAPIVSLRARLGVVAPLESRSDARILFMDLDDRILGFLVDAVRTTQRVMRTEVGPVPARLGHAPAGFLSGAIRLSDGLVLLIDVKRVLSMSEKETLIRATVTSGTKRQTSLKPASAETDSACDLGMN